MALQVRVFNRTLFLKSHQWHKKLFLWFTRNSRRFKSALEQTKKKNFESPSRCFRGPKPRSKSPLRRGLTVACIDTPLCQSVLPGCCYLFSKFKDWSGAPGLCCASLGVPVAKMLYERANSDGFWQKSARWTTTRAWKSPAGDSQSRGNAWARAQETVTCVELYAAYRTGLSLV